jgi:hypothetical protein
MYLDYLGRHRFRVSAPDLMSRDRISMSIRCPSESPTSACKAHPNIRAAAEVPPYYAAQPYHSCSWSFTWKVSLRATFHLVILLFSIVAEISSKCAVCIPEIVTPARVTANCTASSIEFDELPVRAIVFSTISGGSSVVKAASADLTRLHARR